MFSKLETFLRPRAALIAFAFMLHFVVVALRDYRRDEFSGCHVEEVWLGAVELLLVVVAVVVFCTPIVAYLRREVRGENVGATWRHGLAVLARGVGNVVCVGAVLFAAGLVEEASSEFGPQTYHLKSSTIANRVLDAGAVVRCLAQPSRSCNVLLVNEWLPFRVPMAARACGGGLNAETYSVCRIPLQAGRFDQDEFCGEDAKLPHNVSVCPTYVRHEHRRRLGLIVHRQAR